MIITSLPRSGSTKFALDIALNLSLPLYDEPFEYEVDGSHKSSIHEINLQSTTPKSISFISYLSDKNFQDCVVNNHEINFFILEKTDIFLSRQNVQDAAWSYLAYSAKYISRNGAPVSDDVLKYLLFRYIKRAKMFFEYVIVKNKNVTIPELTFTDTRSYREQFARFQPMLDNANIDLPTGLVFK